MIKLFNERSIDDVFQNVTKKIAVFINNLEDYQIVNANLDKLSEEISERHKIQPLSIDLENRKVNVIMNNVPGSQFPPSYDVRRDKSYPCALVNYTFQIDSGDIELLAIRPRKARMNRNFTVQISNSSFTIGYQTLYANHILSEEVKNEVKEAIKMILDNIKVVLPALEEEIISFNNSLQENILQRLKQRKEEIKKRNDQNNDLNKL